MYCWLIAAERQRGSTLFLTLHEVLAFSCPVPGRVIYSRNLVCGGDVSKSGGKLSIQVGFQNQGVGQHNFLDSSRDLVITQGVTRTKLGNLIKCRLKLKATETLQCKRVSYRPQIRLQINQMSIKIESSRNITNMSAIEPKVRMATSVCVFDFKLIKCRL